MSGCVMSLQELTRRPVALAHIPIDSPGVVFPRAARGAVALALPPRLPLPGAPLIVPPS